MILSSSDAKLEEDEMEPATHVLEDTKSCSLKCIQNVHDADKLDARRSYSLLSVTCKTQWILDSLRIFCPGNINKSK